MTMTMTIIDQIRQQIQRMREEAHLKEVCLLDPSSEVIDTIHAEGGEIGHTKFDRWCNSDTCYHNSHDEGQYSQFVYVPESWLVEEAEAPDLFEYDENDEDWLVMIVPTEPPVAVVGSRHRHFAAHTRLAQLRKGIL